MAAKAGAAHFMRCAALELAHLTHLRECDCTGDVCHEYRRRSPRRPDVQEAFSRVIPMHRVGLPADMHGSALFFASDAGDYVTGQEIVIDGGFSLGRAD